MIQDKWWRWMVRTDTVLLMLAILAGIAAAVLSGRFLGARAEAAEASLRSRYEVKEVVVAAADLSPGESLDTTRLAVRKMPREFLPPDAVPASRAGELLGTQAAIQIRRGTPVVAAALHTYKPPLRLSTVLEGERRALTIAVDQVNSQAGNLLPGDWVDLYYARSEGGDAVLVPLLQHVEVLAAGTRLMGSESEPGRSNDDDFSTITLGLSATEAASVVLAQQSGSLSVVLRGKSDISRIPADPRNSRELLLKPARARSSTPIETRTEVLVGGNGGLTPERSWLPVGQSRAALPGDAS